MADTQARRRKLARDRRRRLPRYVYGPLVSALGALAVALAPLVLGYIGLHQYLSGKSAPPGFGHGWADILFYDLQLPVLSCEPAQGAGPYPVALGIARVLAPLVAGAATVAALRLLLAEQWRRLMAAAARGHAIVVGDGPVATELARRLQLDGRRVVLLGLADATLAWARANRLLGVRGEPADGAALQAVGVARALELYACTGAGTANAAVVLQARDGLAAGRRHPLHAYALVRDGELGAALRARRIGTADDPRLRLDFFNVEDVAARKLLDQYPVRAAAGTAPPSRVVIVGFGQLGRAVLREVARRRQAPGGPRAEVVIRGATDEDVAAVTAGFPLIGASCAILPGQQPELSAAGYNAVYVCPDGSDDDALRDGLAMAHALAGRTGHVVACLRESVPFSGVLAAGSGLVDNVTGRLSVFGVVQEACVPSDIRDDFTEQLARAVHARYLAMQAAKGETGQTNSSMVPWERLPANLRQSSIGQAIGIGEKLAVIGAVVVPESAGGAAFRFSADEVELLAKLEHERWSRERMADGWTYGQPYDEARKVEPDLAEWAILPEVEREKDRDAVRAIPAILQDAGYLVMRLPRV